MVTPEGPPDIVVTIGPGAVWEPTKTVIGVPLIDVTTPLPHTCVGPLELGPRNIVIGVPLIVVGVPEPHTALGVGMLLDVALIGHEQELLMGCVDMTIALDGRLLLPARKDEIIPGMAATPCNEDVAMVEVKLTGPGGHDGQTGQGEDEIADGDGMVTTCTVGGGGRAAELVFVGG